MTIRGKLSMQMVFVFASVAVITAVFINTLWSLDQIEKERMILSSLAVAASDFTAKVNCLDTDQVDGARERFDEAAAALESAFDEAMSINEIARSSDEIGKSIQVIANLRPLVLETTAAISSEYERLAADVKKYFYETHSTRIIQFYTSDYARAKYDLSEVYAHLDSFFTTVTGAAGTMQSVSMAISEQEAIIDAEIQKRQRSGVMLTISISVIMCVFLALYTRYISKSIRARVTLIDDCLRPIGEGNLTESVPNVGNDEIASIADSVNALVANFSALIGGTKEKIGILRDKGINLSSHMEETSASILQINDRIANSESHLGAQTASVRMTAEAAEELTENSLKLDAEIMNQAKVIEQSAASVEQVIANIGALTSTTGKVDAAAADLLSLAETGKERIDSVNGSISEINKSSDNLLEAAKLINNIASQTNLLAMNAAIEAAHAGSAGLGFAVVANEIRNLANQSSIQSKRVTADLKSVKNSLHEVAGLSEGAQSSFHNILDQVRGVRELIGGVGTALEEQNSGSAVLLTGIGDLRSITAHVTEAGIAMRRANENISGSIGKLQETTNLVNVNNADIFRGTGEINDSVTAILRMTEENRDLVNALEEETSRFVID